MQLKEKQKISKLEIKLLYSKSIKIKYWFYSSICNYFVMLVFNCTNKEIKEGEICSDISFYTINKRILI